MTNQPNLFKVYTLSCPISKTIRYVGVTKKSLMDRLCGHIYEAKTRNVLNNKNKWVNDVERPIIEVLETTDNEDYSYFLEKFWINQLKDWGFDLLNRTEGGRGSNGFKHSQESLQKIQEFNRSRFPIKEKKPVMTKDQIEELRVKNVKVQIGQYDLNGNFIRSYESIKRAADNMNGILSNITNVADQNKVAYGFFWRRKMNEKFPEKIEVKPVTGNRVILKYIDLKTNQETVFKSILEAVDVLGIQKHIIRSILKNEGKYNHLHVSFTKIQPTVSIYSRA